MIGTWQLAAAVESLTWISTSSSFFFPVPRAKSLSGGEGARGRHGSERVCNFFPLSPLRFLLLHTPTRSANTLYRLQLVVLRGNLTVVAAACFIQCHSAIFHAYQQ